MKELSFRVFDKVSKSMSPEFSLFGEFTLLGAVFAWLDHSRGNKDGTASLLDLNDIEVMQFTGLKDKNGVKVFEGDIIKVPAYFGTSGRHPKALGDTIFTTAKVIFRNAGFDYEEPKHERQRRAELGNATDWYRGYCNLGDKVEVIGDIHKTPELLENKNG